MRTTLKSLFWGPFSRAGLIWAAATFVADQAHKWFMIAKVGMQEGDVIRVTPFLDWKFLLNKGVSYSFLTSSSTAWQFGLAAFAVVASLALAVWLARGVENKIAAISVGLIIGGAIGNGLDRLTLGGVADFFSLHAFGFYWYVFNIADVAIVAGVIGLLYESFYPPQQAAADPTATKSTQSDS